MNPELDRLILGVNPLSNVDHFLRERARERTVQRDSKRVGETLLRAFESGAGGFNFSTNASDFGLLKALGECGYGGEVGLYPMIPDTQTYVSAQLAGGTMGMISQALSGLSWSGKARALVQGGLSLVTADPMRALRILLDAELGRVLDAVPQNGRLKAVLVLESVTDLAMALGASDIFRMFVDRIWDGYKVWPGFITRNFPYFVRFCAKSGIPLDRIVVMTPFNSIGFQMTPTREACEESLAKAEGANVVGMSIMAGGQISFNEAARYLAGVGKLKSVVVGASTPGHAEEAFKELGKVLSGR